MADYELIKKKNRDGEDTGLIYVKIKGLNGSDLIFRNFAGEKGQYNPDGRREFSVKIDNEEVISEMIKHGYNVVSRVYHDKEKDVDIPYSYLKVKLNLEPEYETFIPYIYVAANGVMTNIWPNGTKEDVDGLQRARFEGFDISLDPNVWHMGKNSGVTAYVKRLVLKLAPALIDNIEDEYPEYVMANASDKVISSQPVDDDDVPF